MQNSRHNEKIAKIMDITKDWMEMDVQLLLRPISNSCFPSKFCNVHYPNEKFWTIMKVDSKPIHIIFFKILQCYPNEKFWTIMKVDSKSIHSIFFKMFSHEGSHPGQYFFATVFRQYAINK